MTKLMLRTMLVGGVMTSLAVAQDASSQALSHLGSAHMAMAQGQFDDALNHLVVCYDGTRPDGDANGICGVRGEAIRTWGELGTTFAPARQGLKARRDTAMTKVGTPPKVVPELYDVLAINYALGEEAKNQELIDQLRKAGFKQFSGRPKGPTPPSLECDNISRRIQTTNDIQDSQPREDAIDTIVMSQALAELEMGNNSEQEAEYVADLGALQGQFSQATGEREQVRLLAEIRWLSNQINVVTRPQQRCLQAEVDFYRSLSEFRSRFDDAAGSTGR